MGKVTKHEPERIVNLPRKTEAVGAYPFICASQPILFFSQRGKALSRFLDGPKTGHQ